MDISKHIILPLIIILLHLVTAVNADDHKAVHGYKLYDGTEQDSVEVVMSDVMVRPHHRQKRERYRRKGNTAIDIMREAVKANKAIREQNSDSVNNDLTYEKMTLGVLPFDYDMQKTRLRRDLGFVQKYVDSVQYNDTATSKIPYLNLSMREHIYSSSNQSQLLARRLKGVDQLFDHGGINANINYIFQPIDIRSNNVEVLMNKFVSPLSSTLWNAYYHYYLFDSVKIDGQWCYDIGFVPMSAHNLGFTGHLYITTDSTFALKSYRMQVPLQSNMNWVKHLKVEQNFTQDAIGHWVPQKIVTETDFSILKHSKHSIIARQSKVFYESPQIIHKSNHLITDDTIWNLIRPEQLSFHEQLFDSLTPNLMKVKRFSSLIKTYNILVSEYIPTTRDMTFNGSKFDFGPIYNTVSYNGIEGWRIRIGGMTTANLHPNFFISTYAAYGFHDKRPKGNLTLVYSFNKKKYHYLEPLRHAISLSATYDMEQPGNIDGKISPDHIFNTLDPYSWVHPENWNRRLLYVGRGRVTYEKEWRNRLRITTWGEYEYSEAAGDLRYLKLMADGSEVDEKFFQAISYTLKLRYAPGEPLYSNRRTVMPNTDLNRNAPIFTIAHQVGYMIEDNYIYNRTEISTQYRWWWSSFGYLDMTFRGGIIWDKIPYPKLFTPPTNRSFFLDSKSFNMMRRMEFFTDKYLMWHLTYNGKGWLLNMIPGINKLKLRGVASFSGIWGNLSSKNDPAKGAVGIYQLPDMTKYLDKYPYMEFSVGLDNIFRFFRVDYFRRINYNYGLSGWEKNGVKIVFHTDI